MIGWILMTPFISLLIIALAILSYLFIDWLLDLITDYFGYFIIISFTLFIFGALSLIVGGIL